MDIRPKLGGVVKTCFYFAQKGINYACFLNDPIMYQRLNSQGLIKSQGGNGLLSLFFLWYLIDWLQLLSMEFAGNKNCVVRYLPLKISRTELELPVPLLKTYLYS